MKTKTLKRSEATDRLENLLVEHNSRVMWEQGGKRVDEFNITPRVTCWWGPKGLMLVVETFDYKEGKPTSVEFFTPLSQVHMTADWLTAIGEWLKS